MPPPPTRTFRLTRTLRFALAGVFCWAALIGAALLLVQIKDSEAAAARAPLPSPPVRLTPRMQYMWEHFPDFHDAVPILAYHGVNSEENYLSVTRKRFAQQLLALKTAGFHTVTMAQYARYVATGETRELPSNPILITFDDGRLDSYRGADRTLARFGDTAVMFVVASFPEGRPGWALHWSELAKMQESGRWDIQEHAGTGHHHIQVDAAGEHGEYYAYRRWSEDGLESFARYKQRVSHDVDWGLEMLADHIPGYKPLAFAVPYSNYGQRFTNDPRIAPFFFHFLHSRFPVLIDGDYLDEGIDRPSEIKGRGGHAVSYRITQGPADSLPVLACRLRDFVLRVPLWREYGCIQSDPKRSEVPSVYSE
jgi:peptidoglycan/xylan/chitin deacetylase (PgdA/CDA1 family)